jgi:hypothetical protein
MSRRDQWQSRKGISDWGLGQFWVMRDGVAGEYGIHNNEESAICRINYLASYVLNRKQKDFNIQAASSSWMMLRMESSAL